MSGSQKPLTPQQVRFAAQTAQSDANGGSHERLVNLFAEPAPPGSASDLTIRHVPGLLPVFSVGLGPVRQINSDSPTGTYVVSGSHLFRITNPNGSLTIIDMGDIGNPAATPPGAVTNFASTAAGTEYFVVCVPPYAYTAKLTDNTVTKITGSDAGSFPAVRSVAFLNGFFIFTVPDSSQWFVSGAFAPNTYDALDFAYADANPNILLRVVTHLDRVWLMGQNGIEIWTLTGDADFPFRLDAGGIINENVLSGQSVAICDDSIFWLSISGGVFRTNGYKALRVSTPAIEAQIRQFNAASGQDAAANVMQASSYTFDGHECYALTLKGPMDTGRTWVYDCSTKLWFERSSSTTGVGRWRVNCAGQDSYLGDLTSGALFAHSETTYNDGDLNATRIAISAPVWNNTARLFMDRLEIDCDRAPTPFTLDWSDDDCRTWKPTRYVARSGARCFTTRLGSARRRTIRLQVTDGAVRIRGVYALAEGGLS